MRFEGIDEFRKIRSLRPGHQRHMGDGRYLHVPSLHSTTLFLIVVHRCPVSLIFKLKVKFLVIIRFSHLTTSTRMMDVLK